MTAGFSGTVKGGFFPANGVNTLTPVSGRSAFRRRIAQLMGEESQMKMRALMNALDGVVAGSNATKTLKRIEANAELGGKRTVETKTIVNRNTTAADVTEINADYFTFSTRTWQGNNPVANKDGNPLGTR